MNIEPATYDYETNLKWNGEKKGSLTCKGKPKIAVACPPEFGGHPGIWSPEDLYVGTVEVCLMTTFLWLANREKILIQSYQSRAIGRVEFIKSKPKFTTIIIHVNVGISSENDRKKVLDIFTNLKQGCLVSNSVNTDINIEPEITVI